MIRLAIILLVSMVPLGAQTVLYVRAGASGSGADWNDALGNPPSSFNRTGGDVLVYIADGSYASGYTFDDAETGSNIIEWRKATEADHGTETGWSSTYGDGQADFAGEFTFRSDYYIVDGIFRNESNWLDVSGYGIKCTAASTSTSQGNVGHNITIRYVSLLRSYVTTHPGGDLDERLYLGGFTETITGWTVSRCFMANSEQTIVQAVGVNGLTIEYCALGESWGKEAIRGQVIGQNITIRYNKFANSTQIDPGDGSSGITAEIAIWDGSTFSAIQVYGNTFSNARSGGRNSVVVIGGNGGSWAGPAATGSRCYNNTFAGIDEASVFAMVLLNDSGGIARNNLFYDCVDSDVSANTASDNDVAGADPFVNYATLDLRLSGSTSPGTSLASPFNIDPLGVVRGGDGNWDVGAFEYDAGGGSGGGAGTVKTYVLRVGTIRVAP